jgi:hypothetical protein
MVSVECDPGLFYLMLFHCSLALSRVERDQAGLIAVDALGADLAGFLGIECKIAETLPERICALVYAKLKSFANSIGLPFRYAPPCLLLADMS